MNLHPLEVAFKKKKERKKSMNKDLNRSKESILVLKVNLCGLLLKGFELNKTSLRVSQ